MRTAYCSFCRKSYQDVGPLIEGPDNVFICSECVDLTRSILDQETLRRSPGDWSEYLRNKMDRAARAVEGEAFTFDPRMVRLLSSEGRDVDPSLLQSLLDLCQASVLLSGVESILKRVGTKALKDSERALLQEVETQVTRLRNAVDARVSEQGTT